MMLFAESSRVQAKDSFCLEMGRFAAHSQSYGKKAALFEAERERVWRELDSAHSIS